MSIEIQDVYKIFQNWAQGWFNRITLAHSLFVLFYSCSQAIGSHFSLISWTLERTLSNLMVLQDHSAKLNYFGVSSQNSCELFVQSSRIFWLLSKIISPLMFLAFSFIFSDFFVSICSSEESPAYIQLFYVPCQTILPYIKW